MMGNAPTVRKKLNDKKCLALLKKRTWYTEFNSYFAGCQWRSQRGATWVMAHPIAES